MNFSYLLDITELSIHLVHFLRVVNRHWKVEFLLSHWQIMKDVTKHIPLCQTLFCISFFNCIYYPFILDFLSDAHFLCKFLNGSFKNESVIKCYFICRTFNHCSLEYMNLVIRWIRVKNKCCWLKEICLRLPKFQNSVKIILQSLLCVY